MNIESRIERLEHIIRILNARLCSIQISGTVATNPSYTLVWTAGELTSIVRTINAVVTTKTLTWTAGELTDISEWV